MSENLNLKNSIMTDKIAEVITLPWVTNPLLNYLGRFPVPATYNTRSLAHVDGYTKKPITEEDGLNKVTGYFSPSYYKLKLERPQSSLPAGSVDVWEMMQVGNPDEKSSQTFQQIFDGFVLPNGITLADLVVPENRIAQIMFDQGSELANLRSLLDDTWDAQHGPKEENIKKINRWTQYLSAVQSTDKNTLYSYSIRRDAYSQEWHIGVAPYEYPELWLGVNKRRFVVPALTPIE